MSSPNPPHDLHVELLVNGAWVDIPGLVYQRNPIAITGGYSSETSKSVDPGNMQLTAGNRSGNFSPRNPNGIYYGTLKRNTPIRVSLPLGTYLFWGETASVTPSADQSGQDRTSTFIAGGVLRRLKQGTQVVQSRPRTYIPTTAPTAYWPLEDGPLSIAGQPAIGTEPMRHMGTTPQNWGNAQIFPWFAPTLTGAYNVTNDAVFLGKVTAPSGQWTVDFTVTGNSPWTVAVTSDTTNLAFGGNQWTLSYTPSVSSLQVSPPAGFGSASLTIIIPTNVGHHVRFQVFDVGSNDTYNVWFDGILVFTGSVTGSAPAPAPLGIVLNASSGITAAGSVGVTFGHVAFYGFGKAEPALPAAYLAASGSPGETAGNRLTRICSEQSIALVTIGSLNTTQPCGPQYVIGVTDLLQETADVDGGLLYETIGAVGLTYRTRDTIVTQGVDLSLNYQTNHHLGAPLAPVDDDQTLRNDVTVTRKLGGASERQQLTGALQIAAPPIGVGKYTDSATVNCLTQTQALDQAGWRVNIGAWDEARHPSIKINMNVLPLALRSSVVAMNTGNRITIANPPSWLPPDTIDLLVVGRRVTVTRFQWDVEFICVPYGPYRVAIADSITLARPASDGSTLPFGATSSSTAFSVNTPSGPLWTTNAADFPFDIRCDGERMTVTNITGAGTTQSFTVTRSVNGVVKAHSVGATIDPWFPMIAAM